MPGVNVGVGYVEIKPDLSGFSQQLRRSVDKDLSQAGQHMSQTLGKNLGQTGGMLSKFTGDLGGSAAMLKTGFAAAAAVAGSQVLRFASDAVEAASSVNEAVNATNVIFGEASGTVLAFAEQAANAVGISRRAALESADSFGNLLLSLGATPESAAEASTSLIRLAADIASLYKIPGGAEAVSQKFMSGLVGETEPLRQLGIVINEATVKSKAMELGLGGANRELTEGEKLSARYALIIQGASVAQGDFARTSDSLANAQLRAKAALEDAQATMGQKLVPATTYATLAVIGLVEKLDDLQGAAGKVGNVKVLGVDLGDVAKKTIQTYIPGLKLIEWLHGAGEAAAETSGSLGEIAKTITLAAKSAAATQQQIDQLKTSVFGLTDAQRAAAQAAQAVARADQDLADAKATLAELTKAGAVDEEKVADARERLADATRSAAHANRELADTQEDYDQALAAARILGTDTALETLEDAADDLADAKDAAAAASEREKKAAKDLKEAQAGDPEFQDKLAAARRRVEDATSAVADAEYNQAKSAYTLEEATKKANTALAANAATVERIRDEWSKLLAQQPAIEKFLAGPLGLLAGEGGEGAAPAAAPGASPTTPAWWSSDYLAWHQARYPAGQPGSAAPTAGGTSTTSTKNVTINQVFNEKIDPALVGKAIAWSI